MSELRTPTKVSATSLMLDWIEATFPEMAGQTGIEIPGPEQTYPYQQVFQVGGDDDGLQRTPVLDVYTFDLRWKDAERRAMLTDQAILRYPHRVDTGSKVVLVDKVYVPEEAVELPWDSDLGVTRFKSTVQLVLRG